jgi:hypothetical protein
MVERSRLIPSPSASRSARWLWLTIARSGQLDDPLGELGIEGVPRSSAAVAMGQAGHALALVAGLEPLQVTDREVEGERRLDRRQAACQQLGQHVEPALLVDTLAAAFDGEGRSPV